MSGLPDHRVERLHSAALREATDDRHRRVERRLDVRRAFASRAAYRALLERLLGFHAPLAAVLEPWEHAHASELPVAPDRRARLRADITALGGDPTKVAMATDLPVIDDADAMLGVLYVVEGSALGGAVLARLADRRLGIDAGHGASFFAGDAGDGPPPRWLALLELIEARGDSAGTDRMTHGACSTFDTFDRWLETAA